MQRGPAPTFGKRGAPRAPAPVRRAGPDPHQAFFAAIRAETAPPAASPDESGAVVVPRSLRAGLLAGVVVACALAGLDATQKIATVRRLSEATAGRFDARIFGPAVILLAIAGGGRSAASSLLLAHSALAGLRRTEPWAYALGGAAAGAGVAALLGAVGAPVHGLAVEAVAGGLGGYFYRIFAGARAA